MIELPSLQPYLPVLLSTDNIRACMRAYGEACARAAIEAAAASIESAGPAHYPTKLITDGFAQHIRALAG